MYGLQSILSMAKYVSLTTKMSSSFFTLATFLLRVRDGIGEAVTNIGNTVRNIVRYICIILIFNACMFQDISS